MSKRACHVVAARLCKTNKPCQHHIALAEEIVRDVVLAQKLDREEEAQQALDRIVADVVQKGTHAV